MKRDYFFMLLASSLFIIVILDVAITLYGMSLGFSEGNPFVRYQFEKIGIKSTAILISSLSIVFWVSLIYFREKLTKEWHIRSVYTITAILLSFRAFVLGAWYGIITTYINGGTF